MPTAIACWLVSDGENREGHRFRRSQFPGVFEVVLSARKLRNRCLVFYFPI